MVRVGGGGGRGVWVALNREFYLKASEDGRMSFNLGAPCKHGHRFLLSRQRGSYFSSFPYRTTFHGARPQTSFTLRPDTVL